MKKITARFTKTFVSGYLRGISERQSLTFDSVSAAERWLEDMRRTRTLPYIIEDFHIDNPY